MLLSNFEVLFTALIRYTQRDMTQTAVLPLSKCFDYRLRSHFIGPEARYEAFISVRVNDVTALTVLVCQKAGRCSDFVAQSNSSRLFRGKFILMYAAVIPGHVSHTKNP